MSKNRSYIKIILKVQKLTEFLAQRTSINLFHRLRPYFSGDNRRPDESVIDRPQNLDSSAEFHKKKIILIISMWEIVPEVMRMTHHLFYETI